MNPKDIFRVNERIEVFDEIEKIYYKSLIQEINQDNIAIGIPMGKQELFLRRDEIRAFRILSSNSHYYFKSKILGRKYSNRILLYLIAWPEEIKRIQKRAFFRFPCSFDIYYWILQMGGTVDEDFNQQTFQNLTESLGPPEKGVMADISGGGLQLVTRNKIPKESILALRIPMYSKKEKKTFELMGKIVWADDRRGKNHRHAVEFLNIEEKLREDIIRFIFVLSRERIK